jgi:hypothetical protein
MRLSGKRTIKLLLLLGALLILLTPLTQSPAQTQEEEVGELSIAARPATITYGKSTSISGQLTKFTRKNNVPVLLESRVAPFEGKFEVLQTDMTRRKGTYTFRVKARATARYRVLAPLAKAMTKSKTVEVRTRVTLRIADDTPTAGSLVEFSGTVAPDHDEQLVYIQRRLESGRWRTVGTTSLVDAGTELSEFTRKIRVKSDGVYRARFIHPSDHAPGTSSSKAVEVVGR